MQNYDQSGDLIKFTAGSTYVSGGVVLFGDVVGICTGGVASGAEGTAKLSGVFLVTKPGSQAWTQGQKIYWDTSASKFTSVSATNKFAGYAFQPVASGAGDTSGYVSLEQAVGDASGAPVAANVAAVATADASDLATAIALANQLKTTLNAEIAALKAAGLQASS